MPRGRPGNLLVRVLNEQQQGAAIARNRGIEFAKHDLVLFTDDDCVVHPGWADEYRQLFCPVAENNPPIAAASGETYFGVGSNIGTYLDHERVLSPPPVTLHQVARLVTANAAIHRRRIGDVRFNASMSVGGEDTEFSYALLEEGIRIAWAPKAKVVHPATASIDEITHRFLRYGAGSARMALRGRAQEVVPAAVEWLASVLDGDPDTRMYREFGIDLGRRRLFQLLSTAQTVSFLVGYLGEYGTATRRELVSVDLKHYLARWRLILSTQNSTEGHCVRGSIDMRRLLDSTLDAGLSCNSDYAALLNGSPQVIALRKTHSGCGQPNVSGVVGQLPRIATKLKRARTAVSRSAFDRWLREVGAEFSDACYDLERSRSP